MTADRDLLAKVGKALAPLDGKIDHALHVGTTEQMRADLTYLRGLLADANAAIEKRLAEPQAERDALVALAREVAAHPVVSPPDDLCDWRCTTMLAARAKDTLNDLGIPATGPA